MSIGIGDETNTMPEVWIRMADQKQVGVGDVSELPVQGQNIIPYGRYGRKGFINIIPSTDLAYVLGALKGDGHVKKKGGNIALTQTRFEFAQSFRTALKNIGFNTHSFMEKPRGMGRKPLYTIQASSIGFAQWYRSLLLDNAEKLLDNNSTFIKAFIRGFYESEGGNYIRQHSKCKSSKYWIIAMFNKNKELIDFIKKLLDRIGFDFKPFCDKKHIHGIRMCTQQRNYRFIKEIAPCIKNSIIENPAHPRGVKWSNERIIHELQIFVAENGLSSTKLPNALQGAIYRRFGSWDKAKEAVKDNQELDKMETKTRGGKK